MEMNNVSSQGSNSKPPENGKSGDIDFAVLSSMLLYLTSVNVAKRMYLPIYFNCSSENEQIDNRNKLAKLQKDEIARFEALGRS